MKKNLMWFVVVSIILTMIPVMQAEAAELQTKGVTITVTESEMTITPTEITMPEKSKGSFLGTVEGQYDQIAYLGHEYRVVTDTPENKQNWTTRTPEIITVDKYGYATAWCEGVGILNDGVKDIRVACTTAGDGKKVNDERWMTQDSLIDGNQYCYEYYADKVNSVQDLLAFVYDYGFEYYDLSRQCTRKWVGYGHPKTVLESQKGVCAEAASLSCGLLQYDYEEVGVVNVSSVMK